MFDDGSGEAFAAATKFAGTEAGVAADLPPVLEPASVGDFAAEGDDGEFAEAAGKVGRGGFFQLGAQRGDLGIEHGEDGAEDFEPGEE